MTSPRATPLSRSLLAARWAEAVYALVALGLALGLPPPTAATAVSWVHWLGTAAVAGLLSYRLRRPNGAVLGVVVILAAYVLANAAWALPRLAAAVRAGGSAPVSGAAVAIAAAIWATQLTALTLAVRALRSGRYPRGGHPR